MFCKKRAGIFEGFTDWHCHILPGVDDGVRTMGEALEALEACERLGVREIWLTPHIMEEIPNSSRQLRERFGELRECYKGGVELHLAAEYMLDGVFEERLRMGDLLPLGGSGTHLLVETSYYTPPMGLESILARVQKAGYHPVLAHPERYLYLEKENYEGLKEMGVLFQLNVFSLAGRYGKRVEKRAGALVKKGMYEIAGTDTHSAGSIPSAQPRIKMGIIRNNL